MTAFTFYGFSGYEDGQMARLETIGKYEIPINIFVDNSDKITITEGEKCRIDVCGVGSKIAVYGSEREYQASGHKMAPISLIPMGTFPLNPNDTHFQPSPHILFSGIVRSVEWNPSSADDDANCCLTIETLDITLTLYCCTEATVEPGYIIHGVAWLYGDIVV